MKHHTDTQAIWQDVRRNWSAGNLDAARAALTTLVQGQPTTNAATLRLWADTAAALGDLHLAAQAYKRARGALSPRQPAHTWLNRYLYACLQAGAEPQEIENEFRTAPTPTDCEEHLIGLALETELHYRLGDVPQAAVAGKELLNLWRQEFETAFEFLEHVQDRIWLLLTRLAEEARDAPAACRFLSQLDNLAIQASDLQLIVHLLHILLDQKSETAKYFPATDTERLAQQLTTVLSSDLSTVRPPVPASLLASLRKTLDALQTETASASLLEEAVKLRRTNVLARRLYIEQMTRRGKKVDQVLASEANLWLTSNSEHYSRPIRRFLSRSSQKGGFQFSFVALGGGDSVGGSAYLLDLDGTKLLLDAGLDIATSPTFSYQRLKRYLAQSGIVNGLADLDAVLVSHAHLDHVGLLPALYTDPDLPRDKTSSGYRPKIRFYASEATREVARLMLTDASRLAMVTEDEPLYTLDAVATALDDLRPPKDGLLHLFRNLGRVELLESGHILGSRMIMLEKGDLSVLYTGDFNTRPQLTLPASASLKGLRPDVLIMESTYGYNADEWMLSRNWQERAFIAHLDRVLHRGGVVLLPAFAVGRSQEILGLVAEHTRRNPTLSYGVYLDGLSRKVTELYDRFDEQLTARYRELRTRIHPRLTIVPDDVDRQMLMRERILGRPNVLIASSGMLKEGSAAYQYAIRLADDARNAIFYTGYLAGDSEAIAFLSGESDDLAAAGIDVRCEQRRFHFSAHAPKEDLLQFVIDVQPAVTILVHGDANKRTQVPDNLYALLQQLESDRFRVFLGHNGRRIEFNKGRF